jgi:thioredoxin-related protein
MEEKLRGKAEVIRLDALSHVGRQAAARYGVRGVPTFVVLDSNGQAVYRQAGFPSTQRIIEQVDFLSASSQIEQ